MWKTIITVLLNVFGLARDLEENRKEIKQLNEKVFVLAGAVKSLSDKLDASVQLGEVERRALILQLENELLRANKDVPILAVTTKGNGEKKSSKTSQSRLAK